MDDQSLAKLMLDVVPATMHVLRRELRGAASPELSVPQLRVLAHIHRGVADATSLAELQGVSLPAISKMIDAMVERELVERRFTKDDRRQAQLSLTARGRALYTRTRESAQRKLSERLMGMSASDKRALREGLQVLGELVGATLS